LSTAFAVHHPHLRRPPVIPWFNGWGITRTELLLPLPFAVSLGLTIGLAAVTYQWVESPCIKLGHWLSSKWERNPSKNI